MFTDSKLRPQYRADQVTCQYHIVADCQPIPVISGAQTAFYSLNPDRDIPGPLAINPAYIRLAANHITAQGVGCRASEGKWCGFVWHAPPILYESTLLLLTQYFYPLNISKSNAT